MLSVRLMLPEQCKPGFEERLEFRIVRTGDEGAAKRAVDGVVIGDLVRDIGVAERRAFEGAEPAHLLIRLYAERSAGLFGLGIIPSLVTRATA